MTLRTRRPIPLLALLTLGATVALAGLQAQQAPPGAPSASGAGVAPTPTAFAFEIGHAAKLGVTYSVSATQPATSTLTGQKIRLKVVATTAFDRNTHYFTLATGRYKTVAQLDAILVDVFRRFLANPPPAPGQELAKIGDVLHGGEVRFVVTSANILRFDNLSPTQPVQTSNYDREDVAGLLAALTGPPPM